MNIQFPLFAAVQSVRWKIDRVSRVEKLRIRDCDDEGMIACSVAKVIVLFSRPERDKFDETIGNNFFLLKRAEI